MKQRERVEESRIDPVSRARAYGVTKRETWLTRFNNRLADFIYMAIYVVALVLWAIGFFGVIYMLGASGIAICIIGSALLFYFIVLRTYRIRFKFVRKLKKLCKKNKYRLKFERGFFRSLKYAPNSFDITVDTGKTIWYVRYLTMRKYNTQLTFLDKDTAQSISPRPKNSSLTSTYNRNQGRVRNYPTLSSDKRGFEGFSRIRTFDLSLDESVSGINHKIARKALLINPVPHSLYKKNPDGTTVPTGTGEPIGDYTIFTANGFLQTLPRDASVTKEPTVH